MSQTPVSDRSKWEQKPASERAKEVGHRAYVGGQTAPLWFGLGKRQYQFLISQGLRPHHRFLDVACGSLRLGQFLIPFLDEGNYFGLEGEPWLVEAGLRRELFYDLADIKKPTFGYGYDFDLSFVEGFDYAIAQSLFTHLTSSDVALCLNNLRERSHSESRLFFTFAEGTKPHRDEPSHANKGWQYTFEMLDEIASSCGWACEFIGDWGHERGQKIIKAQPT